MTKRILVPLDPRDDAESLISLVADLARGAGATVRLLHVAPLPQNQISEYGRIVVFASQERERLEARGHDHLVAVGARLEGVPVENRVRFGDLAEETVLESEVFGAELIALGARRRRWWHSLALGRTARRIARRATAPVLVLAC